MSGRIFTILCGAASVFALAYAPAAPAQQGAQTTASAGGGLEEVVVTARRREEKLQSVPVSVTALSGLDIERKRIQSIANLQFQVPSLAIRSVYRDTNDIIELRGLPGVITYLNEVPLGGAAGAGLGGAAGPGGGAGPGVLYDLENVQILKGPQGTLFGRNTTGGAILIQAKKPTNEFEGYAQIQLGNYNDREFEGAINIPVIPDKLLVRFAANIAQRDGFTRLHNGPSGAKDLDSRDYWAERLSVTLRPTDDFENRLVAYSNYKHQTGTGTVIVAANPKVLAPQVYQVLAPFVAQQNAQGGPRDLLADSVTNPLDKGWNIGILDTATWDVSDNFTIKNIASYLQNKTVNNHDIDGSPVPLLDQTNLHGWSADNAQATEELQLQGKSFSDKLNWTVGGFLLFAHPGQIITGDQSNQRSVVTSIIGGKPFTTIAQTTLQNVQERTEALFAQGEYDMSGIASELEGLKITAGYRYTWDWRSVAQGQLIKIPAFNLTRCTQTGADQNCVVAQDGWFHSPGWMIGANYQVTPELLAYVKASKSYQSGGFNLLAPTAATKKFQPEYFKDVEVGVKADWEFYGIRGRTNADWYYGWYDNLQRTIPVLNPANGLTVTLGQNLSSPAQVDGFEFEGTIYPFDGLELTANYSYNHTKYGTFITITGADYSGEPFLYVPKNKYTLGARYHLPIDQAWGDLSVSATYNWQGHEYLGLDYNSPYSVYGDIKTVDLQVNWNDVGGHPFDISFFMNNALDAAYPQGVYALYSSTGVVAVTYAEPRMWGFKLRYRFGPDFGL